MPYFGRYLHWDKVLGRGAGSIVYLCYDTKESRWVAVKEIRKSHPDYENLAARIDREYSINKMLQQTEGFESHSIVEIYEKEEIRSPWSLWLPRGKILTMQYIEGANLYEAAKAKPSRRPTAKLLLHAFYEMARALDFMHQCGYVHCDVDPRNIMLPKQERAVLIDFGLTRELGTEIKPGQLGKDRFMPPEQIVGGVLTAKTDICALGRVMYWAFGGRLNEKVAGENVLKAGFILERAEPPETTRLRQINPTFDRELDELIYNMMRMKPEIRPDAKEAISIVERKLCQ